MPSPSVSRRALLTLRGGRPAPPDWHARQAAARDRCDAGCLQGIGTRMFAPDPRVAIATGFRAGDLTVWRRSGTIGRLLLLAQRLDPPPRGTPPPLTWARDELLRPLLEAQGRPVVFAPATLTLTFPDRDAAVERLVRALPPLLAVPDGQRVRAEAGALIADPAAIEAPYLTVRPG